MKNNRILISGASIAGPTLGFWLAHYGFDVTIVERASEIRLGGHGVDIRGASIDVVRQMGIYEAVSKCQITKLPATILNENGEIIDEMIPEEVGLNVSDDRELLRGDLNQILFAATADKCEYIFNDSIRSIDDRNDSIFVEFKTSLAREFDIVIGADGLHSNVRSLVFGKEEVYSHNLGDYYFAICSIETALNIDKKQFLYSKPGKMVHVFRLQSSQDPKVMFAFQAHDFEYDYKNIDQQKEIIARIFADCVWEVPELLEEMKKSPDFYFDEIKQIRMDCWYKNRTILLGDAAFNPCLASGQGTGLAMIGAYVLAGELMQAKGDYALAFAAYEKELRNFVDINQQIGKMIIECMIPQTEVKAWMDADIFNQLNRASKSIVLKDYAKIFRDK